jgi:hypothetical protein
MLVVAASTPSIFFSLLNTNQLQTVRTVAMTTFPEGEQVKNSAKNENWKVQKLIPRSHYQATEGSTGSS